MSTEPDHSDYVDLARQLRDIRIINLTGLATRVSGAIAGELSAAEYDLAFRTSYDIFELQDLASKRISKITGAEAGIVTCGASASLMMAAAAVIARNNSSIMDSLPDAQGRPKEILIGRSHRNSYDHALRASGAVLREIGMPDRFNCAGVRDAELWEFECAITADTAAIAYLAGANVAPDLMALCTMAMRHQVPVIVDAAGQLPPLENLRSYIDAGASLVAISGGKAIRAPQGTGLLFGRQDLIASALLQMCDLDMDGHARAAALKIGILSGFDLVGFPHQGIGRAAKVGKEGIVSLLFALDRYASGGSSEFIAQQQARCKVLLELLGTSGRVSCVLDPVHPDYRYPVLRLRLTGATKNEYSAVSSLLWDGHPSIRVVSSDPPEGFLLNLSAMSDTDIPAVAGRLLDAVSTVLR